MMPEIADMANDLSISAMGGECKPLGHDILDCGFGLRRRGCRFRPAGERQHQARWPETSPTRKKRWPRRRTAKAGSCLPYPAFLTTVCHCLEQAVPGQPVTPGTASAKQWHTVGIFPRVVRNAGYL